MMVGQALGPLLLPRAALSTHPQGCPVRPQRARLRTAASAPAPAPACQEVGEV